MLLCFDGTAERDGAVQHSPFHHDGGRVVLERVEKKLSTNTEFLSRVWHLSRQLTSHPNIGLRRTSVLLFAA